MRGYRRGCSYRGIRIFQLGYIVGAEASTYKWGFRFESVYLRWAAIGGVVESWMLRGLEIF
jgi:hypothetical protein